MIPVTAEEVDNFNYVDVNPGSCYAKAMDNVTGEQEMICGEMLNWFDCIEMKTHLSREYFST